MIKSWNGGSGLELERGIVEHAYIETTQDAVPAVALNGSELQVLTRLLSKVITTASPQFPGAPNRSEMVARAERHYTFRRMRERLTMAAFGDGLYADPAWDMMLDLYAQTSRNMTVTVTSACYGGIAPPTTALRYLVDLEKRGIVQRFNNPTDKRSVCVRMTERGMELMDSICTQMPEQDGMPPSAIIFQPFA